MDIKKLKESFRPKDRNGVIDCNSCAFDYFKYEYEIVISMIDKLEEKKLQYQKFFATLVGIVGTASITLLNYKSKIIETSKAAASTLGQHSQALPNNQINTSKVIGQNIYIVFDLFSLEQILGVLLIISSFFGYGIVRNLASARAFECFYANTAIRLRGLFIETFNIQRGFDNLSLLIPHDIHSSDYITIIICSFINFIMLSFGLFLVLGSSDMKIVGILYFLLSPLYFVFHFVTIERYLRRKLKLPSVTEENEE